MPVGRCADDVLSHTFNIGVLKSIKNNSTTIKHLNNYINPGYGLSLVDTLWNASSYRQPLEQEGNPMT